MGKPNPEYLRQHELCKKMAHQAKRPDHKTAWLDLAASWLALATVPPGMFKPAQAATRQPVPVLHLKRIAGSTR